MTTAAERHGLDDRNLPSEEARALPFFAYGIFMPGEIAYFQIKPFIQAEASESVEVAGQLWGRDGVPILVESERAGTVTGWKLTFKVGTELDAYKAIGAMEPKAQYRWTRTDGMNVLVARSPRKGSEPTAQGVWHGSWCDRLQRGP